MTEVFKTLVDIFEIAEQNKHWCKFDGNGKTKPLELKDWYDSIADIVLIPRVPKSIRWKFGAAKNVLLYSWFSYEIMPAAELFAYSILEEALRVRLKQENNKKITLSGLLRKALKQGLINDSGFHIVRNQVIENIKYEDGQLKYEHYTRTTEELKECNKYAKILCEVIPRLRNSYAHGKTALHSGAWHTLMVNTEIINMLFAYRKTGR